MARTLWQRRATDVQTPVYVTAGMDFTFTVDLTLPVAAGAVLSPLTAVPWRFPDTGEPEGVMLAAAEVTIGTLTPTGNVVSIPMKGQAKGRAYRILLAYGPAANKRETGVVVVVSE